METTAQLMGELGAKQWAEAEFGDAELGHGARTRRIVKMSSTMVVRPRGTITEMFAKGAARNGAYRALENESITAKPLIEAATRAAVRRTQGHKLVYIPVDGTSLNFGYSSAADLGDIGTKRSRSKGVHVQNSIIVGENGHTPGVAHQVYWRRKRREKQLTVTQRRKLDIKDKESRHWLECIEQTEAAFASEQIDTRRWYILDRGGDFRQILTLAAKASHGMIIRSSWNRRLTCAQLSEHEKRYLFEELESAPIFGHFHLNVVAGRRRKARRAMMEVRAQRYRFRLKDRWRGTVDETSLTVVWTHEISEVPSGEKPLQWRLLTNLVVQDFARAEQIIFAYTRRWRIEEMHRCWKTVCQVEKTQLRSYSALLKYSTIMASVAARIEHLKTASRDKPDAPATELFSPIELQAIKLLYYGKEELPIPSEATVPTAWEAVCQVASLGGYIGPRNGPPGAVTIGRGMQQVITGVALLESIGWTPGTPHRSSE